MDQKTYNVLFICTGNSARSILAEALMNKLGDGRFRGWSAGSHPKGEVHPLTLKTLAEQKLPVDGWRSKSWEAFASPEAPELHFVFTVCDQAAGETCPVWPGQPVTAHWGLPDPAAAPEPLREQAFVDAFVTLKRRIQLMLALPLASLDRIALKKQVTDIGSR